MAALETCRKQYEHDVTQQTHCCMLQRITAEHQSANRKVFERLLHYQQEIDAKGILPYEPDRTDGHKKKTKGSGEEHLMYPENLTIRNPRQLQQVLPIPDVHKLSDCDIIYRFLIARHMDVGLATQDILHYIAFREKYALNTILWDREVAAIFNGLDGEELLQQVMAEMKVKGTTVADKVKLTRPLLQAGWAAWNCGVDKSGHVIFYQRPNPKELAMLEKRWPYEEGAFDARNPDFHSVTAPYTSLLPRLYLRTLEKGRRLSRLLNFRQQHILREGLHINTGTVAKSGETFVDNGGGVTCLIDVGCVKLTHVTSSKYKKAFKLFHSLSMMGQSFYPENMSRMIIVNGGFVFNTLFKLVRMWLDPQTQKKILLLSATNKATLDDLGNDTSQPPPTQAASVHESDEDASSTGGEVNKANYALRDALAEYIYDDFIPSWYGGRLTAVDSPLFYNGVPPDNLTSNPLYTAAANRLRTRVLPELLPDDFLLANVQEGQPVGEEEWVRFCDLTKGTLCRS